MVTFLDQGFQNGLIWRLSQKQELDALGNRDSHSLCVFRSDMSILQMICIVKEFGVGRPMKTVWISLFRIKPGEKKMIFEGQAPFKIMFKNPHPTETFIHNTLRVSLFRREPVGDFHPRTFRSVFFDTNCEWDTLNKGILGHWKDVNKIFRSAQQPKTRKIRNMCSCSTKHQRQERSTS